MEAEIALLQFVALALPAVAILMQAVVRFHEQYIDSSSNARFWIEFRILEFTFIGLVLAGIVFSISIFQNTSSFVTKFGILLLSIALFSIFPATWFTFRRAKYPTQSYESPEEVARAALSTVVKIGALGIPIVILVLVFQFTSPPILLGDLLSIVDTRFLLIVLLFISILGGVLQMFLHYNLNRIEKSIADRWRDRLDDNLKRIRTRFKDSNIQGENKLDSRKIKNITRDSIEDIKNLSNNKPEKIGGTILDEIDNLSYSLESVNEIVTEINSIEDEINRFKANKEEAKLSLSEAEDIISAEDSPDARIDEARESIANAEDYLDRVEGKISELEHRRDELYGELNRQISSIRTTSKEIRNKLDSKSA